MADPVPDYVAYWSMDGTLSPGGGSLVGSAVLTGTPKLGSASLSIPNAAGSYVSYTSPMTAAQVNAACSFCAWIQDSDPTLAHGQNTHMAIRISGTGGTGTFILGDYVAIGVTAQHFDGTTTVGADQSPSVAITANTWTHIAAVWDGAAITLYKNGAAIGKVSSSHGVGTAANFIGTWDATQGWLAGLIDDVRIYSRALSATEVTNIFNWDGTVGGPVPLVGVLPYPGF